MKVAFIIYSNAVVSGKSNGVRSQAIKWKRILESKSSYNVDLIDNWGVYNWKDYKAIHIFGYDLSLLSFVSSIYKYNKNIYLSPIIDSTKPYWQYKLASFNGFKKFRLLSVNFVLKESMKYIKGVCSRSEHESGYFSNSLNISQTKIFQIPLSFGIDLPKNLEQILQNKEEFCLHVSSLYQDRKNVKKLINSAKKYGFNLKLVGNTGNLEQTQMIKGWIDGVQNIELLGYVSYKELIELYKKAKVFALPSTCEGVGIVALDAAIFGCNILMTNIPGPKEYYLKTNTLKIVNPLNVREIGDGISTLLKKNNTKELHNHIVKNYSSIKLLENLIKMYNTDGENFK